ncbi:MAG TPA: glycosyltransferase family 4 protein [Steroidobacteraceae bacterium]|nr:glycosyltransferase family 4 protein [Steroidobacteraceae bacterium]
MHTDDMASVLFHDPLCREPYDPDSLRERASGGTESTVARIADALGARVVQHNRLEDNGRYLRPRRLEGIEHVVVVRESRALPMLREQYPHARFHLWLHDQMNPGSKRARRLATTARVLRELAVSVVCVSDWQRQRVEATLAGIGLAGSVAARTIYNPVADELAPFGGAVDPDRLVFFSSPNKGLGYALDVFASLRRRTPSLRLLVGNPAYKRGRDARRDGVEYLGAQPQARMHEHVRGALCTFAPNFVLPETFGLVYAESKALGTPVLAHDCGASAEVIDDAREVLPVRPAYRAYEALARGLPPLLRRGPARVADRLGLFHAYHERISAWRAGARPQVGPDPRFRLATVAAQWRALLR